MPESRKEDIKAIRKFYKELLLLSNFEKGKEYLKKVVLKYLDSYGNLSQMEFENKIDFPLRIVRSVSGIIGLGTVSITSLILFELLKDKKISLNEIKEGYNAEIYRVTKGLALANTVDFNNLGNQVDLFIDLLLNLSKDIRVILCLLAESLVIVRDEKLFRSERDYENAVQKSYFLFAPIAHKLGFYSISGEIENAYLKITKPEIYNEIKLGIERAREKGALIISEFLKPIQKELNNRGIKFHTKWRTKSIYSIYKKIQEKNVSLDNIYDILAIRIVITGQKSDEKGDCWETYSVVTNLYEPEPERFRDWITRPKITGYESLHTTVCGPSGYWIEVQIRSKRMDEIAENGIAAHYRYKGKSWESEMENWLLAIRKTLENSDNDAGILEPDPGIKTEKTYCFTPKGDLVRLSAGASILDFAYHIHTDVGEHCLGAKVNGKNVSFKYKLKNGDQVEIKTSKNQSPKQDWLKFVRSPRAKSKIKRFLIEKDLKDANLGKEALLRKLKNWKIEYNDTLIANLIKQFEFKNSLELYSSIATGLLPIDRIKAYLSEDTTLKTHFQKAAQTLDIQRSHQKTTGDTLIIDNEVSGVNYRLAKCCKPIKGDTITGFITIGKGISIHKTACANLRQLIRKFPYRKLNAKWSESVNTASFIASLKVEGSDNTGLLNSLTDIISNEMEIHIRHVNIASENHSFTGVFQINVNHSKQLYRLITRIQNVKGVTKVKRIQ